MQQIVEVDRTASAHSSGPGGWCRWVVPAGRSPPGPPVPVGYPKIVSQSRAMLTTVHPSRAPTSVIGSVSEKVWAVLT